MKLSPSYQIEAAATRIQIAGRKAMQHPIASILSLCVLAGVAATVISYSQAPDAPLAGEVAPLALPADNVELVDVNGRKITVTVLSMAADKQSIVVRLADGRETPLLMSRLNPDTVRKLTGAAPAIRQMPVRPRAMTTREIRVIRDNGIEASKAVQALPIQELIRLYQANDPKVQPHIDSIALSNDQDRRFFNKFPELADNTISPMALIGQVKLVEGEEKVSLRPEFERVGVKATQQVGDTCSTYSAQHLFQYAYLAAGKNPPTTATLMALTGTNGVKVPPLYTLRAMAQYNRQRGYPTPKVVSFNGFSSLNEKLFFELVKHQLRSKRAVVASNNTNSHAIVIVGFHTTADGKTIWEYLDSNRVWQDKGYKTTDRITSGSAFSIWFENGPIEPEAADKAKLDPTVETPGITPQEEAIKFYATWMAQGALPGEKAMDFRQRIGAAAHPAKDALRRKTATELQEGYLNRDPTVMAATLPTKIEWARNETALLAGRGPDHGRIGFSTRINNEYIRSLAIKDPQGDERVSLREEMLKIGVKPTQQDGPTCAFYSLFHMLQYACLKDGREYPSVERIRAAVVRWRPEIGNRANPNPTMVFPALESVCGKRPMVMDLRTGIPALTEEVVKQELRNGRPCCLQTTYRKDGINHAIVVIGFETKGGVTTWEYLDSNKIPTENGSGFNTFPNEFITPVNWESPLGTYSLWFK